VKPCSPSFRPVWNVSAAKAAHDPKLLDVLVSGERSFTVDETNGAYTLFVDDRPVLSGHVFDLVEASGWRRREPAPA
jgi:hypothetical protein